MKKNDVKKILDKSATELAKDITEAKEKLWELKRDIVSGKVKNAHSAGELRRTIARMLTVMHNKQTSK
jgi:ribosomal protein L29